MAVAYLTASIFLFGGAFAGIEGLVRNIPIAAITFLATIAREVLKDAEDVEGDAIGGARTLPMIIGIRGTGMVAFACASGQWWQASSLSVTGGPPPTSSLSGSWTPSSSSGPLRGLGCTTPDCVRGSRATSILRAGMFAASRSSRLPQWCERVWYPTKNHDFKTLL